MTFRAVEPHRTGRTPGQRGRARAGRHFGDAVDTVDWKTVITEDPALRSRGARFVEPRPLINKVHTDYPNKE